MTDRAERHKNLATDLRDLRDIANRRLAQLRDHGTPEAIQQLEEIRQRSLDLLANVEATRSR